MSSFDDDDTKAVYPQKDEDSYSDFSLTREARRTVTTMKRNIERSVDSARMWTWRQWIRPVFVMCYSLVACGATGVMIWDLLTNYKTNKFAATIWMVAGACAFFAIGVSCYGILSHVVYFSRPNQQRYIVRILLMVPIYSIDSSIALRVPASAIILDSIRACYQAFVVYCFLFYLLHYLTENYDLDSHLSSKPQMKSPKPFCCLKPGPNSKLVYRCRNGVLNFVIIGPLTTFITLIIYYASDDYTSGSFAVTGAWLWVTIVSAISQIWAMYCLAIFYQATKEETLPLRPLPQMLCVKFAIFGSFFQQIAIALLIDLDVIKYPPEWGYNKSTFASTVHNFLIGFEMAVVSVIHLYAFTHKPYKNDEPLSFRPSCRSLCDYSDMKDDIRVHSGRFLQSMKKSRKNTDELIGQGDTALVVMNGEKPFHDDVSNGSIKYLEDDKCTADDTKKGVNGKEELKYENEGLVKEGLKVPNNNLEEISLNGTDSSMNPARENLPGKEEQHAQFVGNETHGLNPSYITWNSDVKDHHYEPTQGDTDVDVFGMTKTFSVTTPLTIGSLQKDVTSLNFNEFSDLSFDKELQNDGEFPSPSKQTCDSPTDKVCESFFELEHTHSDNPKLEHDVQNVVEIPTVNNLNVEHFDPSQFYEISDSFKHQQTDPFRDVSLLDSNEAPIHHQENNEKTISRHVDPFAISSDC